MHWEEEGWKPYRGPRKPEGLLEVMRTSFAKQPAAGAEPAGAEALAEAAAFEQLVRRLEAGQPDARQMAELATSGMASHHSPTKELAAALAERSFTMGAPTYDPELRRSSAYSQLAFGVFVLRWPPPLPWLSPLS